MQTRWGCLRNRIHANTQYSIPTPTVCYSYTRHFLIVCTSLAHSGHGKTEGHGRWAHKILLFLSDDLSDQTSQHLPDRYSPHLQRCRNCMTVDEQSKGSFFDPPKDVAMATNFVGQTRSNPHSWVLMPSARSRRTTRSATAAQTNCLIRWTHANHLID